MNNSVNQLVFKYNEVFKLLDNFKSENLGLYFSFILHALILLFAIGLPNFFGQKSIVVPTIIPIEIVNIADVTSIPKEEKNNKESIAKQTKVKEKKFNSSDNQEIKKIDIQKKPIVKEAEAEKKVIPKEKIIVEEKKDLPKELIKEKTKIEINEFESLPTKKIKPKLKPKLDQLNIEKSLNSDVVTNFKPKPKPPADFNIASMLKDLRNEKTTPKIDNQNDEKKKEIVEKPSKENTEQNSQMSISEIDLVLQQLSKCFIAPAGAEIKKNMFVKISAKIQQNRRVLDSSIRIVDTNIAKSNPVYGPITESAMRTLLNPECIPLKLPENKYESWKNLTMKFDYSVMRGN